MLTAPALENASGLNNQEWVTPEDSQQEVHQCTLKNHNPIPSEYNVLNYSCHLTFMESKQQLLLGHN